MPEVTGTTAKTEVGKTDSESKPPENSTSDNGISSTSKDEKSPEKSEGEILLAQGKRHLFVKDYPNAVAVLGDACAKLSEIFGELADECAEAYFCYGRALLELAREESNVLGTDPDKEDCEEGDDEEEEPEEENDDKSDSKMNDKEKQEGDKVQDENHTNEGKEKTEPLADEAIGTTKEGNEEPVAEEEKEEDVDNLQLAWEVFELAKKIYERQNSEAKLAETYLYLGEVGLESESYSGAIDDMKRCVEIQKKILAPDHRDIAETYFQLGVACSLSNEFDEAILHFKTSSEILETRIKNLGENGAPQADTEKNPFYSVEKEVAEIKALLPEIKTKIADMEDFKQETIKSVMATLKEKPSSDGAGPSSSSVSSSEPIANGSTPKPATDISHLVRKKRKPEEEVASEKAVKKTCTDEASK